MSDSIVAGDDGVVTVNVQTESQKSETLVVEHSINGESWQSCGVLHFVANVEVNIRGLRPDVQYVRLIASVKPTKAQWL